MADEMFDTAEQAVKAGDVDPTSIEAKETGWGNAFLWYFYDAADTYFSQLIISIAFTPFALVMGIYQLGWSYEKSFIIVSIFMAASNLLIAVLGPIMGSLSDRIGKRKGAVIIVASIMIATSAVITAWVNFWWACIMFLIANFCYQAGRMFYDAQIPFIAKTEQRSVLQAVGGSLAFFGSVFAVLTSMMAGRFIGDWEHIDTAVWEANPSYYAALTLDDFINLRWLFVIGAIAIFILAFPYIFHKEVENPSEIGFAENLKESVKDLRVTLKEIVRDKNSILFFLSWFFITDAANTAIMYMAVVIQGAVGYPAEITNYVIFAGIGGSFIFAILTGFFMNKFGPKLTFIINGICWSIAIIIIIFSGWEIGPGGSQLAQWPMFIGAFFIGVGFGGIWIVGRQFIMELAPPSKLAQYGGFQKIAGRVSAIVSPLLFSGTIFLFAPRFGTHHAYRFALGQLFLFFIIGVILLFFIVDPHRRYLAGQRAPYVGLYDKEEK
jgi:UMF1 family MFS transporter